MSTTSGWIVSGRAGSSLLMDALCADSRTHPSMRAESQRHIANHPDSHAPIDKLPDYHLSR